MPEQTHRIVDADESELHDEPHVAGSRITVLQIHERVEERGLEPETVADRYDLPVADIYHALAYYHDNREEMSRVREQRQDAVEAARERGAPTLAEDRARHD
jgi:uncharacterized protein (DUF433 family)